MAIKKPSELSFTNKKINMIIAGVPGIGKTTLALSAPKPLLIDLDCGVSRVEAKYRTDTLQCSSYNELINDLKQNDLTDYETIVIDTGGKLLEMLKPVVISESIKNAKNDGSLSLQGYGAIKRKFKDFTEFIRALNKHLVFIFHATEVALQNDLTGLRIRCEGSSKDEIWDDIDLGGFVEMNGNKRKISFNNCDRFYAKGTHQIHGSYDIPDLNKQTANNFLTLLFNKITEDLNNEVKEANEYNSIMGDFRTKLAKVATANDYNALYQESKNMPSILTAKAEINHLLKNKLKEMNLVYDKERDLFSNAEPTK